MVLNWFRRKTVAALPADPWTLARIEEDGLQVVLRFRSQIPTGISTGSYPHLINIYWRYEGGETAGMPPRHLNERMVALEELLDPLEGPELGFMVLAVTGNSRREWIWYVSDKDEFTQRLNVALGNQDEPFPIELETKDDPTWAAFTQLLPSTH